ncbi:MAG TPA: ATP-dependent sacrificial sulfur transferase LarE [Candidatus Eisenbacteria bacterium]|nr:ATP-dependent sacrificial sulfur transferase LarE [Candidatus Eisenbacteria bacterium]
MSGAARAFSPTAITFTAPPSAREIERKRAKLHEILATMGRTLVAYSGGVDSAVLLVEAHDVLGDDAVVGVIAKSASLPEDELRLALETAALAGAPARVVETNELARAAYRANAGDRCYHCKAELFERLGELARDEGFETLAYGAVTDDLGEIRPGMAAAAEFRVRAPLIEAGLSKLEVRSLARRRSLLVWDKPQSACLASRIPVGSEVTEAKLLQVAAAERWIRANFRVRVLRVRHGGETARIEVAPEEVPVLTDEGALGALRQGLREFGFSEVEVDRRGYRRPDPIPQSEEEADGERR